MLFVSLSLSLISYQSIKKRFFYIPLKTPLPPPPRYKPLRLHAHLKPLTKLYRPRVSNRDFTVYVCLLKEIQKIRVRAPLNFILFFRCIKSNYILNSATLRMFGRERQVRLSSDTLTFFAAVQLKSHGY